MTDTVGAPAQDARTAATHRPVDIPALTGLRAVAAALIVVHHLRPLLDLLGPGRTADALRPVLFTAVTGLDVFFLLSGFVIAHNYAHVLANPAPGAVRSYLHARVARVYPLHLVTLLMMCVVLAAGTFQGLADYTGQQHTPLGFLANLFMLQGLPGATPWNFPSWSLTCEFAAYLLFPLFAARVLRVRWTTAVVVAALAVALQMVVMFHIGGDDLGSAPTGLPRIAGEFTAGAMGWVVWRRVLRPGPWADGVVVLCASGVLWSALSGHVWLWTVPLLAVMVPAVACATGPIGKLLAHPVSRWGGRVSFAVYLVHILVVTATIMWLIPQDMYVHHSTPRAALVLAGIFVASVVLGALLHHGVEEPARRWMRRRWTAHSTRDSRDQVPAAPTAADSGQ